MDLVKLAAEAAHNYMKDEEEYANYHPEHQGIKGYAANIALAGAVVGSLGAGVGSLFGKGCKAGVLSAGLLGVPLGIRVSGEINRSYAEYQKNPQSYAEKRRQEFRDWKLPNLQGEEDYYAKWRPEGMSEAAARAKYRAATPTERETVLGQDAFEREWADEDRQRKVMKK